jgi:glycosyltransferase involved in cell wall biosynthesis
MRLAVIASHPVQYYAPWFRHLAENGFDLRVFYLWDFGTNRRHDPGFGIHLAWDVPLLEGYAHEFVPNTASDPGTHHPAGLQNPELLPRVHNWKPDAIVTLGYSWQSIRDFIRHWNQSDVPLILRGDSHDLARAPGPRNWAARMATRWIFRKFDAFLACGTANTDYFRRRGASEDRIFFCPHAIDMDRFQRTSDHSALAARLKNEWGVPSHHRVVLFAGKFEMKKRPLDLLQAFQNLSPESWSLVFVGSGELDPLLRQKASTDARVRIVPFANQSTMPAVYAAADLFVLPSFGPHETWGLAVQEALACGVPVLVSDHVGCHADLVQHGRNGNVFRAGHIGSLTSTLADALRPDHLSAWAAQARPSLARHTYAQATDGLKRAVASIP